MILNYWLYNSFTDEPFQGHTAAIVEVQSPLEKQLALKITKELCQTVCCFFWKDNQDIHAESYAVDGSVWPINHGLLGVIQHCFQQLENSFLKTVDQTFKVSTKDNVVSINLPKENYCTAEIPERLNQVLGIAPVAVREVGKTCVVELRTVDDVKNLKPDFNRMLKLDYDRIVVTAEDNSINCDYVCRYFSPKHGIIENNASLYIQTFLSVYWQEQLEKNTLSFIQLSPRLGNGRVKILKDSVVVTAPVCNVFEGKINIA